MKSKRPHNLSSKNKLGKIKVEKTLEKFENLSASYSYTITEPGKGIVKEVKNTPCHSFVANFVRLLFNTVFYLSTSSLVSVTDTSGTAQTTMVNLHNPLVSDAGTGTNTYGLQVGTGTGAESINDTALGTLIAHGTGAGQLQYGTMTFGAPTTTATTTTFRYTRVFTNNSAGSITVQEMGLVGNSAGSKRFLLLRDLTGAVAIGVGQSLTLNVDFTTTI